MTEQVISEVLSRWDLIADGLMALSPRVYETYIRQAFWVNGVKGTIASLLFLIVLGAVFVRCGVGLRKSNAWYDGGEEYMFGRIFSGAGLAFSFICFVCSIGYLMNPEYYAIQKILETLFGK